LGAKEMLTNQRQHYGPFFHQGSDIRKRRSIYRGEFEMPRGMDVEYLERDQ